MYIVKLNRKVAEIGISYGSSEKVIVRNLGIPTGVRCANNVYIQTESKTQTKAPEKTKITERKLIQTTDLQTNRTITKGTKQNIKKLNNKVKKME